jgi:hypothetical protein
MLLLACTCLRVSCAVLCRLHRPFVLGTPARPTGVVNSKQGITKHLGLCWGGNTHRCSNNAQYSGQATTAGALVPRLTDSITPAEGSEVEVLPPSPHPWPWHAHMIQEGYWQMVKSAYPANKITAYLGQANNGTCTWYTPVVSTIATSTDLSRRQLLELSPQAGHCHVLTAWEY